MQAIIAKRFVQTPADVTALRDGVPRNVARALHQALARTAIDRFPNDRRVRRRPRLDRATRAPTAADPPPRSIAVLPFVNLSTDRDNDYLGDGIAEDIINALASIEGLHVAARASAFSFKGKNAEPREIGERLRVATVLEGSIRRSGSRIRITAQLMAVADGYQLWSERYDREMVDVFAVQDEIASAIAKRLQLTFAAPPSARDAGFDGRDPGIRAVGARQEISSRSAVARFSTRSLCSIARSTLPPTIPMCTPRSATPGA